MRDRSYIRSALFLIATTAIGLASARDLSGDIPGASDIPGIPRIADSVIIGYRFSRFDRTEIPTGLWQEGPEHSGWTQAQALEGRRTRLLYLAPPDASALEVARSYRQALEPLGYHTLFQCSGSDECGAKVADFYVDEAHGKKLTDNQMLKYVYSGYSVKEPNIYVAQGATDEGTSTLFVFAAYQDNYAEPDAGDRVAIFVEELLSEPLQTRMVLLDADSLAEGLEQDGRIAIHGVQFDFDQATIRPESQPQLEAMAALLHAQPELAVYIVGHTDDRGGLDYNMDLSQRRASAVVQALSGTYGIATARMTPMGVANLAPLASNATEAGRATNRRVELVTR